MSINNRRLFHRSNGLFLVASIFPAQEQKNGSVISSLMAPEDTTDSRGDRPFPGAHYRARDIRGSAKALFWVVVSVILSVLVGQLY